MAKFQNKPKNNNKKPSHNKTKFKKSNSKTAASNPNKRGFQKKIRTKKIEKKPETPETNNKEGGAIINEEKPKEIITKENEEENFNEQEFYFDDNDNIVDDAENLDFGEDDYIESDEDSQVEPEEEEVKEKILTEKAFQKIYLQATKGKPYALTKLVQIFSKLINPEFKSDFNDTENIINSHSFYKKMIKIAVKTLPDLFNVKISSFQNKNDIPTSIKQLIKRFLTKYSYFITYSEKGIINFIFKHIHKLTDLVLLFKVKYVK